MHLPTVWLAITLAGCLLCGATNARAYTISSALSEGCHEQITSEALRRVRAELATAPGIAASADERALLDDLTFGLPKDQQDLAAATLLIAVRDNDLKGRHATDLAHLALVHGDPEGQREHCLRATHHVEPSGSKEALDDCRAFIRERLEQALAALDEQGIPDPADRTKLPVYLALRHRVEPRLPTFYVRMGQALHALEDSFTHTYRSLDGYRVRVVTNWIHEVGRRLDEARHGPPHRGELDACKDLDELRKGRKMLATDAATATLRAALDPARNHAEKLAALDAILDRYLSFEAGCTFENDWCDAPERDYKNNNPFKCALAHPSVDLSWPLLLLALIATRVRLRMSLVLLCLLLAAPSPLAAQEKGRFGHDPDKSARNGCDGKVCSEERWLFGGYAGGAGAVDHGALAITVGARARCQKHWIFGLDAEWNPFISDPRVIYNADHFRPGVFNGYATLIFRLPLANEAFNVRATASLGFSTMLMDLYGAPSGTTGLFAAFTPLGLEWKMSRVPYLIINPLGIAMPTPQLRGVPFMYAQYRFSIGVELYGN